MALSGSSGNTFSTGYRIQLDWSGAQSIDGNYTDVYWEQRLISLGSSYTINSSVGKSLSVVVDGQTFSSTVNVSLSGNQNKLLASGTKRVFHNQDGAKSFSTSVSFAINVTLNNTYYGTISIGSALYTLDTIPRATAPTLNYSTREMGLAISISANPASSSFSHKHYYSFTGISKTLIATMGTGNTSHSWTIPTATLAPKIPNALSGIVTIITDTYSGTTLIGSKSVTFTATVPDYQPTASISASGVDLYSSKYIQSKSKVSVSITDAGLYGSTITSRSTKINGATYTTASFTTGLLIASGTNTIEATVTDSRGKTRTVTQNITVVAYIVPRATSLSAVRCNSDGTPNEQGAFIKASFVSSISTIDNTNTKQTLIRYKKKVDSTYTTALTNTTDYSLNTNVVFTADINSSYDVRLQVADYYNTSTRDADVGTAFTLLDFHSSGNSMAIGKVAEGNGLLEIGGNVGVLGILDATGLKLGGSNIVESGSNANGDWIRYADGTQICWMKLEVTDQALNTALGGLFTGIRVVTYPVIFIGGAPVVTCTRFQWSTGGGWGTVNNATTSSCTIRGYEVTSRASGTITYIYATAIGRWK